MTDELQTIEVKASAYLKSPQFAEKLTKSPECISKILSRLTTDPNPHPQPLHVFDECEILFEEEFTVPPETKWNCYQQFNNNNIQPTLPYYKTRNVSKGYCEYNNKWKSEHEEKSTLFQELDMSNVHGIYKKNIDNLINNNKKTAPYLLEYRDRSRNSIMNQISFGSWDHIGSQLQQQSCGHFGSTWIRCHQPGYIQGIQRNKCDATQVLMVMKGLMIIFVTDQMNDEQSHKFQDTFSEHNILCPVDAFMPQQSDSAGNYIPKLPKLCAHLKSQSSSSKLYVCGLRPGNIAIIKGSTYFFTLTASDENTWTKSMIIAPNDYLPLFTSYLSSYNICWIKSHNDRSKLCEDSCSKTGFGGCDLPYELTVINNAYNNDSFDRIISVLKQYHNEQQQDAQQQVALQHFKDASRRNQVISSPYQVKYLYYYIYKSEVSIDSENYIYIYI